MGQHKIVDCSGGTTCAGISNILTTYVQGEYEGARPATLSKLKEALLAGNIVRKKVLAFKLDMPIHESDNSLPNVSSDLEIIRSILRYWK